MISILLLTVFLHTSDQPDRFSFRVKHPHVVGSCLGTLTFTPDGVRYETTEKGHSRFWRYPDVKYFEIVSTHEIYVHTFEDSGVLRFGEDRDYDFQLIGSTIPDDLYKLLVQRSPRAVINRLAAEPGSIVQEIPVRHRHNLGGCEGTLIIGKDKVIYKTSHRDDSRVWQLKDLQSFASIDPFHLRLSTAFETFNFDLKLPLEQSANDLLWNAVNAPEIQSYRR
jgi:hypothetical protein